VKAKRLACRGVLLLMLPVKEEVNTKKPRHFVILGVLRTSICDPRVFVCDVVLAKFSLCVFPDQPECLLILHEDIVIEGVASGTHSHECSPVG